MQKDFQPFHFFDSGNKVFEGFVKSNSMWQNNVGVAKVSRWDSSKVTHLPPASFDPHCTAYIDNRGR